MLLTFYVHRKTCDFTAFHKTCNITHHLRESNVSKLSCASSRVIITTHLLLEWNQHHELGKRKQCHWLSFAILVLHMMSSHVTEGSHTSCLFWNSLWRGFEKEKHHLLSVVLGHDVMFILFIYNQIERKCYLLPVINQMTFVDNSLWDNSMPLTFCCSMELCLIHCPQTSMFAYFL